MVVALHRQRWRDAKQLLIANVQLFPPGEAVSPGFFLSWVDSMRRLFFPALTGLLVFLSGCSGGLGSVSGEVKFNAQPLPNGRITFICSGGQKPALSADITNGRYAIANVPVGHVDVVVETFNLRSDPVPGGPPPPPVPKDYKYVKIPTRYGDAKESGLGFDVVRGDQTKDFNLTP